MCIFVNYISSEDPSFAKKVKYETAYVTLQYEGYHHEHLSTY